MPKKAAKAKKKTVAKKKPAVKKTAARKKVAVKKPRKTAVKKTTTAKKVTAVKTAMTKSAIMAKIAEDTGLKKSDVNAVFESLSHTIECHIGPKAAAGSLTIPGLMKIQRIRKPAKKARKGINPFTGEEMMFKAKPAHNVIKIRALKKLKEMAGK